MYLIGKHISREIGKKIQNGAVLNASAQTITDALLTLGSTNYITELGTGNYIKILQS